MGNSHDSIADPLNAVLRLRPELQIGPREFGDRSCFVIEDRLRGKFYRVGMDEYVFIALLDGTRTVQNALAAAAARLRERAFSENEGLAICHWLLETQLVENCQAVGAARAAGKVAKQPGLWNSVRNPLCIRVPLFNPTGLLNQLEAWLAWTLGKPFFLVWLSCVLYALILAADNWDRMVEGSIVLLDPRQWWLLAVCWLLLKLLHETYHGLVSRKFGGAVHEAGIFVLFFAPVPYVELSASWRFDSKWQRIATAAAGMYIELLVAALAIICWSYTHNNTAKHLALGVAAMASVGTLLVNANPLMRFDGYFILSDLLGVPNLNTEARRWLASLAAGLLGSPAQPWGHSPGRAKAVMFYAIAALIWRTVIYSTLCLALLVLAGRLHMLVAVAVASVIALGLAYRAYCGLAQLVARRPAKCQRPGILLAVAMGVVIVGAAYLLVGPSTIRLPGVVDYRPLATVRAASPGFIRRLFVEDGDTVTSGQVLAVMENNELRTKLRMAQLEIEKSVAECRVLRQAGETAKEQAHLATQVALIKKAEELASEIESLTVRAPASGRVVGRDIAAWLGRYVETGTELFAVGDERSKEVIVAIPQDDVDLLGGDGPVPIQLRPHAVGATSMECTVDSIDQRALRTPPHDALSSQVGGPLPVRVVEDRSGLNEAPTYELLDPYFKASVHLTAEQSDRVRAGQLATIAFATWSQSPLRRLNVLFERWYARQLRK